MSKYRLRENQHGHILLQRRAVKGKGWDTVTRYNNLRSYEEEKGTLVVGWRGTREKAQIVEHIDSQSDYLPTPYVDSVDGLPKWLIPKTQLVTEVAEELGIPVVEQKLEQGS